MAGLDRGGAMLSGDAVADHLIEAIHGQRLAAACAALLAQPGDALSAQGRALAEAGLAALEGVAGEIRAAREAMLAALGAAGVQAVPAADDPAWPQFPAFTLDIPVAGLAPALAAAAGAGYPLAGRLGPGAVAAMARYQGHLDLMRLDAASTRMRLRWPRSRAAGLLPARLRPAPEDHAALSLPAWAWPLHAAAKPLRILRGRVAGRATDAVTGAVNLGTPEALIEPLLDLAGKAAGEAALLVDIGCGDGRVLRAAARRPGWRAIGVERNPVLAAMARDAASRAGLGDRIAVREGDAGPADLAGADAVFVFLPGHVLAGLLPGLLRGLSPGAVLIAHEQAGLSLPVPPARSIPVFAGAALTVAHLWAGRGP
jgi:SAM-dependent methyltransferase